MSYFYLIILLFFISCLSTILYRRIAVKKGIVANPNYRTLHVNPIPAGGGIVFSLVFVVGLLCLWWLKQLSNNLFLLLAVGGGMLEKSDRTLQYGALREVLEESQIQFKKINNLNEKTILQLEKCFFI